MEATASTNGLIVPEGASRRDFLGSSEIAAILGLAPEFDGKRQTAYDVWLRKTSDEHREEMDPERKLFLARRKRWEPVVIEMLREEFDAEIISTNVRYRDPDLPFLAAEIDFEYRDGDGEIGNGEIKTVSPYAFGARHGWGAAGTGDVPVHYEAQVQMGLGIRRRARGFLVAMVGLDDMVFYPIERSESNIEAMRLEATRFWNDHVLARVPPEPQTLADLDKLFPTSAGSVYVAEGPIASAAMKLRSIDASISALEIEREFAEFEIKRAMADAETLLVNGRKVITWKNRKTSSLDQAGLKREHPAIYRAFMRKGTTRSLVALRSAPAFEKDSVDDTNSTPEEKQQ